MILTIQGWGRLQGNDYDYNYFVIFFHDYDYNYLIQIYFNYYFDYNYYKAISNINHDYILFNVFKKIC